MNKDLSVAIIEDYYCYCSSRSIDLEEEDPFRISPGDERTRRELIIYLQRFNLFEESLQQIEKVKAHLLAEVLQNIIAISKWLTVSLLQGLSLDTLPSLYLKWEGEFFSSNCITIFILSSGLALLRLGKEEESRALLKRYIQVLRKEEEDAFTHDSQEKDADSEGLSRQAVLKRKTLPASKLGEIASVALYEKDYVLAREYGLKAVEVDKQYIPAYKV
jgi:hypothetical protein